MEIIDIDSSKLLPSRRCYNASILEYDGKLLMAYRRVCAGEGEYEHSDIGLCTLDSDYQPIKKTNRKLEIELVRHGKFNNQEDPRLFMYNEELYCSFINCMYDYSWPNQGLCKLDSDYAPTKIWFLNYGHNWNASLLQKNCYSPREGVYYYKTAIPGIEKNWTFFGNGEYLNMLYWVNPTEIVRVDLTTSTVLRIVKAKKKDIDWKWGNLSGGTPPVLHNGEYHTFFHSFYDHNGQRVYAMGYYAFEAKFPYKMTKISKSPIIEADKKSLADYKHAVVFPCGAIIKDDEWLISCGWNDAEIKLIKVPHEEILKNCKKVS